MLALEGNQVIGDFAVAPEVITPNGDGINDAMAFTFSVGRVSVARSVALRIHDLAGNVVREVAERRADPRGRYTLRWAGDDDQGNPVPPGVYLARLQAEVDSGSADDTAVQRVVHVAY